MAYFLWFSKSSKIDSFYIILWKSCQYSATEKLDSFLGGRGAVTLTSKNLDKFWIFEPILVTIKDNENKIVLMKCTGTPHGGLIRP